MMRVTVPSFAADYPNVAETLDHTRLPFYCSNCQRKRETCYLTPDFGPFCNDCLLELDPIVVQITAAITLLKLSRPAFNSTTWEALRRCQHALELLEGSVNSEKE